MNIIDNFNLLSPQQVNLLQSSGSQPFQIGKFQSLDEILTSLHVNVFIEPGIIIRSIPSALDDAEKFWREETNRLESSISNADEAAYDNYRKAREKVDEIRKEKELWTTMTIRGLYDPSANEIKLYPEEMLQEYNGVRMDELLVSTLAHETMHAYFNRPRHKSFPYVVFVEEPLAELGKLLYLYKTGSNYYHWAYLDVSNKKTCYHYGATLMDQYLNGDTSIRDYLNAYKIKLNNFPIPTVDRNGGTIALPKKTNSPVQVGNRTIIPNWRNIFKNPPRYFYDNTNNTLGLDGDWRKRPIHNISFHMYIDIMIHHNPISQIYLGDNFTFNGNWDILDISKCNVVVSLANNQFYAKNGMPFYKKDNTPVLEECGDGLYELCRNDKWGVVDAQLNQIVPFKYDCVWSFDDNDLILVRIGDCYGLVNKQGKEQVPVQYEDITSEGKNYKVKLNGQEFLIDKYGNRI